MFEFELRVDAAVDLKTKTSHVRHTRRLIHDHTLTSSRWMLSRSYCVRTPSTNQPSGASTPRVRMGLWGRFVKRA